MYNVRLRFKKSGACAYISHLDLMKTMQRSLVRSELPVKYSQGFNPHIYLSILAPLSTGFESDYELCDFDFDTDMYPENVIERLNSAFPMGIKALEAYESKRPLKDIEYSVYEIRYEYGNASEMEQCFKNDIIVTKESKRQSRDVNVNEYIKNIAFEQMGDEVLCTCTLCMGNDPLNPVYVTKALQINGLSKENDTPRYKRIGLLDKNFQVFR